MSTLKGADIHDLVRSRKGFSQQEFGLQFILNVWETDPVVSATCQSAITAAVSHIAIRTSEVLSVNLAEILSGDKLCGTWVGKYAVLPQG